LAGASGPVHPNHLLCLRPLTHSLTYSLTISFLHYSMTPLLLLLLVLLPPSPTLATIARCQDNCGNSTGRKSGPTQPANTRPHPWKPAPFPTAFGGEGEEERRVSRPLTHSLLHSLTHSRTTSLTSTHSLVHSP
jgi:hypothetical protein